MAWVTGTAGWMYRAITEYMIGVRPVKNGLLVKPCFPKHWDKAFICRVFRERKYEIEFVRAEKEKIIFNGKELEGNVLPVEKLGETNIVNGILCQLKLKIEARFS